MGIEGIKYEDAIDGGRVSRETLGSSKIATVFAAAALAALSGCGDDGVKPTKEVVSEECAEKDLSMSACNGNPKVAWIDRGEQFTLNGNIYQVSTDFDCGGAGEIEVNLVVDVPTYVVDESEGSGDFEGSGEGDSWGLMTAVVPGNEVSFGCFELDSLDGNGNFVDGDSGALISLVEPGECDSNPVGFYICGEGFTILNDRVYGELE